MEACLSSSDERGDEHCLTIAVRGEIDLTTSGELLERLFTLARPVCGQIALDLSGVGFMDCAGLHMLAALDRRVRRDGGAVRVAAASPAVARLFELLGTGTVPPCPYAPDTPRPAASLASAHSVRRAAPV